MNIFSILFTFLLTQASLLPEPKTIHTTEEVKGYIFLHESCRISQYYTLTLKELYKIYGSEELIFEGISPNPNTSLEALASFKKKYELPFELSIDHAQALKKNGRYHNSRSSSLSG